MLVPFYVLCVYLSFCRVITIHCLYIALAVFLRISVTVLFLQDGVINALNGKPSLEPV